MTFADYAAIEAVNWSTLRELRRSPLHYRHALTNARKDTPAMRLGRAIHCRVLEPLRYGREYLTWAGTRRGKGWDEFEAANEGRGEILNLAESETVEAVAAAVFAHDTAAALLAGGEAERVIRWTDSRTGIACKARLDYVRGDAVIDLKSTRDASPRAFGRNAYESGYHGQIAFYLDGLAAQVGPGVADSHRCYLIAVENEAPHAVAVYEVNEDALEVGRREYRRLLTQLAECRAANEWPGYGDGTSDLWLPDWAYGDGSDLSGLGLEAA